MWLRLAAVVLVGQFEDSLDTSYKIVPFPPMTRAGVDPSSPTDRRRILEAYLQAQHWAMIEASELYPLRYRLRFRTRDAQMRVNAAYEECKAALRWGAYRQICEAYGIGMKTLDGIVRDDRVKLVPFAREGRLPNGAPPGTIRMARSHLALMRPTRFDPDGVILPPKAAARHGYRNPESPR